MYEKVNPAHPDKVADRIAGALVDLAYGLPSPGSPVTLPSIIRKYRRMHIYRKTRRTVSAAVITASSKASRSRRNRKPSPPLPETFMGNLPVTANTS